MIQINITDEQLDDRLDEALKYYADYHYDGSEKIYLKHTVTQQDIDNRYIYMPESVMGVVKIFNPSSYDISSASMFSVEYQHAFNALTDVARYDAPSYYLSQMHINMMDEMLIGQTPVRYNRHLNKLHIDTNWSRYSVGQIIIIEAYRTVDPEFYSDVWADRWLQQYTTAKIKYQWGSNLTKFIGMQLPGGQQFNGELIYQEAKEEISKLEEEMISAYSMPVVNMIG